MSLRLSASALAIAVALAQPARAELLITEYLEGSSNNKAIELTNSGTAPLDLAQYRLALFANGRAISETPTNSQSLSGSLAPGASMVLVNASADATLKAKATLLSAVANFNGDDALVLYRNEEVIDSLGQVGVDPGTAWVGNGLTTLDMTLRRQAGITQGRVDATASFDPSAEYVAAAKDDVTGLGCSGEASCGEAPVAFVCPSVLVPIPALQSDSDRTPFIAEGENESPVALATKGRVTQVVSGLYKGFFLQDVTGDGNPQSSDGLFVYSTSVPAEIKPGVEVCVQGKIKEYYQLTELAAEQMVVTDSNVQLPEAVALIPEEGESLANLLERHEGMRVRLTPQSDLRITRNFGYDYAAKRNNMLLSQGAPLFKPTQKYPALSAEATALAAANRLNQLVVDSDSKAADGVVPWYPALDADSNYLRIGARISNLSGVLGYSYDHYRLLTDNQIGAADIDASGWDRRAVPELANSGDLRVASFNVLNFFTTAIGGDANPTGTNRGATTQADFQLQRSKIVNALRLLNADVVGLMEIENNGYGSNSAIANLVTALNATLANPDDHYAYVASPDGQPIGSDAITVGLIYRPARVTPTGSARILPMPTQSATAQDAKGNSVTINQAMRDALLQQFTAPNADAPLTLVVNHLKSKGSACFEDYPDYVSAEPLDLQGHCNALRVSAAKVLRDTLADESGDLLLLGDLNAYGQEDPVRVLTDYQAVAGERAITTAAHTRLAGEEYEVTGSAIDKGLGLINLNTRFHGTDTYSYSYEGELGNLDQALANRQLAAKVIGIEDWHINAAESNLFEYSPKYTGSLAKSENPYSSSDHDPILIAISYPQAPTGSLSFTSATAQGKEGSSLQLLVKRSGGSRGEASVSYRLSHNSTDEQDVSLTQGTLHWAAGAEGEQSISLALKSDKLLEGDEQCQIELFDASGASLGETSRSTITIADLPPALVNLGKTPTRIGENRGWLRIPLERSGDLSQPLRVQLKLTGGTARLWHDFIPWGNTSFYWPAGDASPRALRLWILDDWSKEQTEQLVVSIAKVKGGEAGATASATIAIRDNDAQWQTPPGAK